MDSINEKNGQVQRFFKAVTIAALTLFAVTAVLLIAVYIARAAGGHAARELLSGGYKASSACFFAVLAALFAWAGITAKKRSFKTLLFFPAAVNAVQLAYVLFDMPDLHGAFSGFSRTVGAFSPVDAFVRNALALFCFIAFILSKNSGANMKVCAALALPAGLCRIFMSTFGYSFLLRSNLLDFVTVLSLALTALEQLAMIAMLAQLARSSPFFFSRKSLII